MAEKGKLQKWLDLFFICLFFLTLFLHSQFSSLDLDLWWYLRVGQSILENHTIPRSDIYSFTAFGQPLIEHRWLAQVIYFLIYKLSGLGGLSLFKSFIVTLTFFILYRSLRIITSNTYLALLATFLAFLCGASRFVLRAETISYLFFVLSFYILFSYKYHRKDYLWLSPLLMIVWVSIHASALLGCGIFFIFTMGEYLSFKIRKHHTQDEESLLAPLEIKKLWIVSFIVFLATFINVHSYHLHLFLLKTQGPDLLRLTSETASPSIASPTYYAIFFFTCIVFLILNYRKLELTSSALFILGFSLSQHAVRHLELFAILSTPFLVHNMKCTFDRIISYFKNRQFSQHIFLTAAFLKTIVLVILIAFLIHHRCYLHPLGLKDLEPRRGEYPIGAVDFIERNNITGHMFNDYGFGGFLIWKLFPREKVFMDGRFVCYWDNGVFDDFDKIYKDPVGHRAWQAIFDKYKVDYTILRYSLENLEQKLAMNLYLSNNWVLVYWDEISLIYVKDIPKFRDVIKKYATRAINPIDPTFQGLESRGGYLEAIKELERKIQEDPECFLPYDRLGIIYEKQNDLYQALEYFKKAVKLTPYSDTSHFNVGLVSQRLGLFDEARLEYLATLKLNPAHTKAYTQMGILAFLKNDYSSAIRYFQKAIKVYKDQGDIELAYLYLGASYQNIGRYKIAKIMYNKALELNRNLKDAQSNLDELKSKGLI